jgi:hypothetical protein
LNHPVIMGRKTWDSIPLRFRPLPGRVNIVITRQSDWQGEGALRASGLPQALELCGQSAQVWIIGGAQLYAVLQTMEDATPGPRKIVIRDAGGREIVFADPSKAVVAVMTGLPTVESVQPYVAVRGSFVDLLVRGRNLQQGRVHIIPDSGIDIDSVPQVSADGTTLTLRLFIQTDAPLGSRVVQVTTPTGASFDTAVSANTFTIASAVQSAASSVVSPSVGVMLPGPAAEGVQVSRASASPIIGVLYGTGVADMAPRVGVIGEDVEVVVRGQGLQGLSSVSFDSTEGLSVVRAPTANADGTEARFTVRVAADAPLGIRKLTLLAQGVPLTLARPEFGNFLVSALLPELSVIIPQVIVAGQPATTLTVRGRNFINVTGVRIEPGDGLTIGPLTVDADGSGLSFSLQAAAGAVSGPRTVIVSSAAGDSSAIQALGNTVRIAAQVGPTYAAIATPAVGVLVGNAASSPSPAGVDSLLVSPPVGVHSEAPPPAPAVRELTPVSAMVGVTVGTSARSLSPTGWLRGASGTIVVNGHGLTKVTTASLVPDAGVLLGTPLVNADGTQLLLPITVAPDAPATSRQLHLRTAEGDIAFAESAGNRLDIGRLPTRFDSISPIVLERGKAVTLTIRGKDLASVTAVAFEPTDGLRAIGATIFGEDSLGEYLTVNVSVTDDAPLGQRVMQLVVPGGATSMPAQPSNTVTVVVPQ